MPCQCRWANKHDPDWKCGLCRIRELARMRGVVDKLEAEVEGLKEENIELNQLFDMQWRRMGEATEWWRELSGKHDISPDLGDLLHTMLMVIYLHDVVETGWEAEVKRLQDKWARLTDTDYEERVADLLQQASGAEEENRRLRAIITDVADGLQHDELRGATSETPPGEWQAIHDEGCSRCMLLAALRPKGGD